MSAFYKFELYDGLINKSLQNEEFSFDNRKTSSMNIVDIDGEIIIDLTELVNVKALYIYSAKPIIVKINSQTINFNDFMFIKVTSLTSLSIQTVETTAHLVNVILWGSDA